MAISPRSFVHLLLILSLQSSVSFAENDTHFIVDLISELRNGIAQGFHDQRTLLQRLRFLGMKRHRGIVHIFRNIQKLTQEIEELKSQRNCYKNDRNNTKSLLPNPSCSYPFNNVNGECIFIAKKKTSWDAADNACRSLGGFLYDGRNEAAYNLLRGYLRNKLEKSSNDNYSWVGGRYVDKEWKWVKNSKEANDGAMERDKHNQEGPASIATTAWASLEPRTLSGIQFCMALDATQDYKGVSNYCRYFRKFICSY